MPKIYTKTGDSGTTSLFGGKRVSKADLQIETYGALDELNSFLGLVEAKLIDQKDKELITVIQNDLYAIMAHLSGYPTLDTHNLATHVLLFEKTIDTGVSSISRAKEGAEKVIDRIKDELVPDDDGNILQEVIHRTQDFSKKIDEKIKSTVESVAHVASLQNEIRNLRKKISYLEKKLTENEK